MSPKCLYFIAILPPQPLRDELWTLKERFREDYQSKASLNSPAHITLHMPFEWKVEKEEKLVEGLRLFANGRVGFDVSLTGFGCFAPRVIFIHVDENEKLTQLHNDLMRFCKVEFNVFNARYKDQAYDPHLTLAFRDLRKPMFHKAWAEFQSKPFSASFQVKDFTLLKLNGKRWEVFHDFSLA